jgi:hypothetical protein
MDKVEAVKDDVRELKPGLQAKVDEIMKELDQLLAPR